MRKPAGVALIAVGIVLAVVAVVTFAGAESSDVGQAGAIEQSLTSNSTTTSTMPGTTTTEPAAPEPLWQESVNKKLNPGDSIEIGYADGSKQGFVVAASSTYLKNQLPLEAIFSRTGPSVLTLITCGGGFDSSVSRYDSNVVVYATPVEGSNPMNSPTPSNIN